MGRREIGREVEKKGWREQKMQKGHYSHNCQKYSHIGMRHRDHTLLVESLALEKIH